MPAAAAGRQAPASLLGAACPSSCFAQRVAACDGGGEGDGRASDRVTEPAATTAAIETAGATTSSRGGSSTLSKQLAALVVDLRTARRRERRFRRPWGCEQPADALIDDQQSPATSGSVAPLGLRGEDLGARQPERQRALRRALREADRDHREPDRGRVGAGARGRVCHQQQRSSQLSGSSPAIATHVHPSPDHASRPSRMARPAITRAITGSSHHQPKAALAASPRSTPAAV